MKTINILLIIFLLAAGFALAADNVLTLSGGKGLPGSADNIVAVHLDNQDAVRGLQFRLIDNTDYLTVDSVWTDNIERPQIFQHNYYGEINTIEIVLLQNKKKLIDPQSMDILFVSYSVSEEAPSGQTYNLEFEEVTVSNVENVKLPYSTKNSTFVIEKTSGTSVSDDAKVVQDYSLEQNYPNPFNPVTRIQYNIPQGDFVSLGIYNALGQKIRTLVEKYMPAGQHNIVWNGLNEQGIQAPSGVYFYRIQAGSFQDTKTLTLMK